MAERSIDELKAGIENATPEEPFLMSKREMIAHMEAQGSTGCGGYSSPTDTNGRRDVGWDYDCKD